MFQFTKAQRSLRNGQDKLEIWVVLNRIIYDVTASKLWQNGKHHEHWAGKILQKS